jgi:hypothetical protein
MRQLGGSRPSPQPYRPTGAGDSDASQAAQHSRVSPMSPTRQAEEMACTSLRGALALVLAPEALSSQQPSGTWQQPESRGLSVTCSSMMLTAPAGLNIAAGSKPGTDTSANLVPSCVPQTHPGPPPMAAAAELPQPLSPSTAKTSAKAGCEAADSRPMGHTMPTVAPRAAVRIMAALRSGTDGRGSPHGGEQVAAGSRQSLHVALLGESTGRGVGEVSSSARAREEIALAPKSTSRPVRVAPSTPLLDEVGVVWGVRRA